MGIEEKTGNTEKLSNRVLKEKRVLEEALVAVIGAFTDSTGFRVQRVDVSWWYGNSDNVITGINVDISLP